ncbi:MAG TPA: hypothetical protein PKW55_04940 [Spirochaetota bacterium]|nr:hypothetical protein [Spirochaetota bacterium]HOM37702.1 hypothetical protein [Spirochaetota bacterium]HPQ49660.1 hypothetical protein [Spirochaetota bacterium]
MELYINNNKVDYRLNNEKSLNEVVNFLKTWVSTQGGFIKDILVNGNNIESISDIKLEDIKRMDVIVSSAINEVEETVPVLKDYIQRFIENIESPYFTDDKNEKIEGILWVIDAITLTVKSLKLDPSYIYYNGRSLDEIINFLSISLKTIIENIHNTEFFKTYFIEGIKPKLSDLILYIERIIDFYNFIVGKNNEFLKSIISEIDIFKNSISGFALMINEGRDRDVLVFIQKLLKFFEFLMLVLSLRSYDISSYHESIINSFNSVYEYFKEKDYVSVIDIIEYEISEKLDRIRDDILKVC